ncbi:MAG: hypothetical protein [Caudoviricetes sp.]|nr:MAG: hypothetical protein [Caudoviricetes sp.]
MRMDKEIFTLLVEGLFNTYKEQKEINEKFIYVGIDATGIPIVKNVMHILNSHINASYMEAITSYIVRGYYSCAIENIMITTVEELYNYVFEEEP